MNYWPYGLPYVLPSSALPTIPDCIRYIIGVMLLVSFDVTLNHRRTFLLHSNTLASVKAEI